MVKKAPSKNRKWIHLLLWGVMILYLFIAPVIKDKLTIVTGKPVEVAGVTLESSDRIRCEVERIKEERVDGQWVYVIYGWSYIMDDTNQENYTVLLVLSNKDTQYFFTTKSDKRKDIEAAYPDVEIDLTQSGFTANVAKELIANGNYDIGLLYTDKTSGGTIYQLADMDLVKVVNEIKMKDQ